VLDSAGGALPRGAVVCGPADWAACICSVRSGLRVAPLLLGCSGSGRHPVSEFGTGSPIRVPRACAAGPSDGVHALDLPVLAGLPRH
jgi:hypothetical protein